MILIYLKEKDLLEEIQIFQMHLIVQLENENFQEEIDFKVQLPSIAKVFPNEDSESKNLEQK